MKKLFALLTLAVALVATPTFAQQQAADTVQVDVTKLTTEQLKVYQELKALQARSASAAASALDINNLTPEKVDKYAQMGKGLGIAINEGLSAVTKNVEAFSQTSAGKWLMVLITWKVMGNDAVDLVRSALQWVIGGSLLLVGIPFWIFIINRNCIRRPIASVEKITFWTKKITYVERSEPIHADLIAAYGVCFVVFLGVVAAITFIH